MLSINAFPILITNKTIVYYIFGYLNFTLIMALNKSNEKFRQHAKAHDRLIEGFHRVMKPKSVYNLDNQCLIEDNIISTVKLMKLIKYQKLKTPEKPNYFLKKTDYLIHRKYERKKFQI